MSLIDDIEAGFIRIAQELNNKACKSEISDGGLPEVAVTNTQPATSYKIWINPDTKEIFYSENGVFVSLLDEGYY